MCFIDRRRLQHTFSKHARDFGITGNWNQANAALLEQRIQDHVTNPAVQKISGTYRGVLSVTHYLDPVTDLWVAVDAGGAFIAGWRLTPAQKANLLSSGNIQ
jgi:hypothetical protein